MYKFAIEVEEEKVIVLAYNDNGMVPLSIVVKSYDANIPQIFYVTDLSHEKKYSDIEVRICDVNQYNTDGFHIHTRPFRDIDNVTHNMLTGLFKEFTTGVYNNDITLPQ